MRRRSPDPDLRRDLDELEAALAGTPDADPILAALVADARAARPQPPPAFTAALDERAAHGFVSPSATSAAAGADGGRPGASGAPVPPPRSGGRRWRLTAPVMGVAAASLLALAVGVAVIRGGGNDATAPAPRSADAEGGARPAERAAGAAPDAAAPNVAAPEPGPADTAPQERTRRVERRATLALGVPRNEIGDVAADVLRVTNAAGGIVASSSVADGTDGDAGASFDLRIPSSRLEPTLARLSELGTVQTRTQSSLDITSAFVAPRERLQDARAERAALLRALAKADTPNETASIRARLRVARQEIAAARADLRRLAQRTNFSAVSVTLEPQDAGAAAPGPWTPGDALDDAARILRTAGAAVLLAVVLGLPVAVVAGLGWIGARAVRRRRRDRALAA